MKPGDFEQFEDRLDSNHMQDAFVLLKIELNGEPDPDDDGQNDLMSIRFTYAESPQDLENKRLKQIKFWLYKEDGEKYGHAIHRTASDHNRLDPGTKKGRVN